MRLLLLGGPRFLGRALAAASLAAGHELTFFNRGRTNPGLYREVESIVGDREGDLSALEGRRWDAIVSWERALGGRFLEGLPDGIELYGIRSLEGRVPTFCFNVPGRSPEEVATFLASRDVAVWHGDYYAVETMRHLGLENGAVRAGIVHYNTEDEVDRLLAGLTELA